jgi:hypothetical protein
MSDDTFKLVIAGGVVLAAVCFLGQAITMMVMLRTLNKLKERTEPLVEKGGPLLDMMHRTATEVLPKIVEISTDAVEISKSAREQVNRVGELLTDISVRAKAQVARIDGAVEQTVGKVEQAGESAIGAVLKPVREVNGMLAGIKTAISVYSHGRRQSVDHATQDEEMFI